MSIITQELEPVVRLSKDLRDATRTLTPREARYFVDAYYSMQEQRIRAGGQIRQAVQAKEPHELVLWFEANSETLEHQVRRALQAYAESSLLGRWSLSIYGIGPVIASGLLAHIDINKAPTVGHIWRFAGLDPTVTWERSTKRPWNAHLKTLCWKIGESFKKFSGRDECYYGKVYTIRKVQEVTRNDAHAFADQAAATLARVPNHKQKSIYADGRLPDGRLDMRAMRYAVKLFLAHWHHVAHESILGSPPPKPYIIVHGDHVHYLAPPNWPME